MNEIVNSSILTIMVGTDNLGVRLFYIRFGDVLHNLFNKLVDYKSCNYKPLRLMILF